MSDHPIESLRFLSARELSALTGLSAATIWRLRKRGELPEPIRLSPGRVGWATGTVRDWYAARAKAPGR